VATRALRPRARVVAPPGGVDPRERLVALTAALTEPSAATVVGPVDAAAAADELLAYLERHGYRR
jgi:electron transfer flavoprotein beta subunit